jgi:hypothetical protein
MKHFILRRHISYTETAKVSAESWDEAKSMLENHEILDIRFTQTDNDQWQDEKIEFIGES